ncbi:MAG: 2,4-dihydroxyhept-2-ene-1,7-dioic acid aldolase [Chloroflexi bacterium]|nr:2,4-dihydroxyhept-2-ene-1,7-dioic acid aldolase [Chloroflexota bacterium]
MRENRMRTLLREGKPTIGTRVQSSLPNFIELIGRSGNFDYVEFLAEYAPYDLYALDNIARAIELSPNFTGLIKMERSAQEHLAVRAMAAGIQNLLFTDVRNVEDVRQCIRIVRPEVPGNDATHGMAGGRAAYGGIADLIRQFDDAVIVVMIEKKGAVENLEEILRVPGLDMIQFGPSDYGMSVGAGGQRNSPAVQEARDYTFKTALKMGVRARAEIMDVSDMEYYLNLGVKDFNISTDSAILSRFYAEQGGRLKEIVSKL